MSCQKLLQQMIIMTLVMLLLVECGAPAATPVPPTATPETAGGVKGVLVYAETGKPVSGEINLMCTQGPRPLPAGYGQAMIDDSGAFLIENLQPAECSLWLWSLPGISSSASPLTNEEGAVILFEVVVGQVVDLGTIPVSTQ